MLRQFLTLAVLSALHAETENDYYRVVTLPIPQDLWLEVSGIAQLPDGRIAVCIRKGEVWLINGAYSDPPNLANVKYTRFASGLHEPLGLTSHKGALYTTQRSEVTKLVDSDGDDQADEYLTAAKGWGVSGNYHEYAYGPVFDPAGNMYVNLNAAMGKSVINDRLWRGWSMRKTPDGKLKPFSGGMRSPIGIGLNHLGDVFATDHQGNWFPTCPLYQLKEGVFHGHVEALSFTKHPNSTIKSIGKIKQGMTVGEAARAIGPYELPAVWFPYEKMGMGSTGILCDTTDGKFGPFANQLFVGDFTLALISRVFLEKVGGEYQGACFPFRKGFDSAVVSLGFGKDGSMFVGQTNRGWNSVSSKSYGLQRLIWTGKTPFELKEMKARPNGFGLVFTKPVDAGTAQASSSYKMISYTYPYHASYGGPEIQTKELMIEKIQVSDDRLKVSLIVDGLRESFVHELHLNGVRSRDGKSLLHPRAYYTLNNIPK
jgi:hypothetical protein